MDAMLLIFMAALATLLFIIVYFLLYWIQPARTSPAYHFIMGKRKKKPVCALDNGATWIFIVGEEEGDGFIIDQFGLPIFTSPGAIKYGHGVRFGVGENHRSILANPNIVRLLKAAKEENVTASELKELINWAEEKLNPKDKGVDNEAEETVVTEAVEKPQEETASEGTDNEAEIDAE